MNNLDVFFKYVSKYIFLVPLLLIIVGIFSYFSQGKSVVPKSAFITPTKTLPKQAQNSLSQLLGMDLQTGKTCASTSKEASVSASIKNDSIYGIIEGAKKQHVLVKADCIYYWEDKATTGKKICGISKYAGILKLMKIGGSNDSSSLLTMLPMVQQYLPEGSEALSPAIIENLLKSCKKADISNALFEAPKSVVFSQ